MNYQLLAKQLQSMFTDESDKIANMANMSAFIYQEMPELNWVGFYIVRDNNLVLGPFQGKIACVRIPWGKGVCGSAAQEQQSILVKNVHEFPGHIACDSASNSELVVPVIKNGKTVAVFDLDSPVLDRFTEADRAGIESLIQIFLSHTDLD